MSQANRLLRKYDYKEVASILKPEAYALRPVRALKDGFRYYEATTFPENPWQGCEVYLRRLAFLGHLREDEEEGQEIVIDVLNANGDIIQDFPVSKQGFNLLRRWLKFKVDTSGW